MLNLIPAPRGSVHMQEGSVKLPETVTVSLGDFAPWCLEAFAARLDGHVETAENGFITLKKVDIAKEGYKLTVTKDGITVEAADESGVVWALTTVTELTAEGEALPIVTIEDAPHYGHRGLSLDCSRHFFTAAQHRLRLQQLRQQHPLRPRSQHRQALASRSRARCPATSFPSTSMLAIPLLKVRFS